MSLPATAYELLDVMERLRMAEGETLFMDVKRCAPTLFLSMHLDGASDLNQLNALAWRLAELDERQNTAFEGLVQMEVAKREGLIQLPRLIDLAYSTDCCHVVSEARNDAQLGRFYAQNGFIPELDGLSDKAFELLDFEKIGREARLDEDGVFTGHGYVVQHEEVKHIFDTLDLFPHKPDYTFRLTLEMTPDRRTTLDLPATEEQMETALQALGITGWKGVSIAEMDGALPNFACSLDFDGQVEALNDLAEKVQKLDENGQLKKYKAVLDAVDCHRIYEAIDLADGVDDYILEPNICSPEAAAREELGVIVSGKDADLLIEHLDLRAYGKDLLERQNAALTDYGLVQRRDGQPLMTQTETQTQGLQLL
jgi:hypothetical protein